MLNKLYRLGSRVVPMDFTKVLVLDLSKMDYDQTASEQTALEQTALEQTALEQTTPVQATSVQTTTDQSTTAQTTSGSRTHSLRIELLSADKLATLHSQSAYELNVESTSIVDGDQVICIGAYVDDKFAGYLFFCASPVDARHNSGGSTFTGISMNLSDNVRYLFKVFVLPEFRRKQIAQEMIRFAARLFRKSNIEFIVTTTDWTNAAFLRTVKSVGFTSEGLAGEVVLLGKHYYLIPKKLDLNKDTQSFVSLLKPN